LFVYVRVAAIDNVNGHLIVQMVTRYIVSYGVRGSIITTK